MASADHAPEAELDEEFVIVIAYTICYPWTVMIKFEHTSSTLGAVSSSLWLPSITFFTILILGHFRLLILSDIELTLGILGIFAAVVL